MAYDNKNLKQLLENALEIRDIDVSQVTDFSYVFNDKYFHNKPNEYWNDINRWNTSKGKNFTRMFDDCTNFNQPLKINTSNSINFDWMFQNCENFNQPLKIDTSNGENFCGMFFSCESLKQELWLDLSKAIDVENMKKYSSVKIHQY